MANRLAFIELFLVIFGYSWCFSVQALFSGLPSGDWVVAVACRFISIVRK